MKNDFELFIDETGGLEFVSLTKSIYAHAPEICPPKGSNRYARFVPKIYSFLAYKKIIREDRDENGYLLSRTLLFPEYGRLKNNSLFLYKNKEKEFLKFAGFSNQGEI